MALSEIDLLHRLARRWGVETAFRDYTGSVRRSPPEALLAALAALGAPVRTLADVPAALRGAGRWERWVEPVAVAWRGRPLALDLRLPAAGGPVECRLELENGEVRRWRDAARTVLEVRTVDGVRYERRRLSPAGDIPPGYHRLWLSAAGRTGEVLVIAAETTAYLPKGRLWGLFAPLYALGSGNYTDLADLVAWTGERGGHLVGTLPLLAAFLDEPFAPSPYQPVSRLFWNEFYIDLARVPELAAAGQAATAEPAGETTGLVDYRRGMAQKRRILAACARACRAGESLAALHRWLADKPAAVDYARFRAAGERRGTPWPAWPERERSGWLQEGDWDPAAVEYHLYVQWLADTQLGEVSAMRLYLDFPLGVHPAGYDTWRERDAFVPETGTGAPPDGLYAGGQNWGFPPLHPERIREQGYRYYIACLRHHLARAGALRLDHVMGLHRLYWVPQGLTAREGVYVRYRAAEFYAILCLESRRHRTVLVGEDLGTVPGAVRRAMARHRIHRMYVLPFECPGGRPNPVPANFLACLDTHDTVPFASFRREQEEAGYGAALPLFLYRRGFLDAPAADTARLLRACLAYLAAGRAGILMINLEDLWLETARQNVPGTTDDEHPNWRRRARYGLAEFARLPQVVDVLREVDGLRRARQIPARMGERDEG